MIKKHRLIIKFGGVLLSYIEGSDKYDLNHEKEIVQIKIRILNVF